MKVAAESNQKVVHEVLDYFVTTGNYEALVALLYTCYHLIDSTYVAEVAFEYQLANFVAPYKIYTDHVREQKLIELFKRLPNKEEETEENEQPKFMLTY